MNVPGDWNAHWRRCHLCGASYHASEGGCACEDYLDSCHCGECSWEADRSDHIHCSVCGSKPGEVYTECSVCGARVGRIDLTLHHDHGEVTAYCPTCRESELYEKA